MSIAFLGPPTERKLPCTQNSVKVGRNRLKLFPGCAPGIWNPQISEKSSQKSVNRPKPLRWPGSQRNIVRLEPFPFANVCKRKKNRFYFRFVCESMKNIYKRFSNG